MSIRTMELPSQLFEHWALQPEVLAEFARRFDTGERQFRKHWSNVSARPRSSVTASRACNMCRLRSPISRCTHAAISMAST